MSVSRDTVATVFREEYGRIAATLIRVLRDFDEAEEVLQDTLATALEVWPRRGIPDRPAAWIAAAARRRALDRLRRRRVREGHARAERRAAAPALEDEAMLDRLDSSLDDDRLRLIFTCCHPALEPRARVALTLRTLCGLTTPEIARAFLVPETTLAQRLVRAKRKIRTAGIPYRVPPDALLAERLPSVLAVVYLVFNEGYAASNGPRHVRVDLCAEAIRLGRVLAETMPREPEVAGLLALMLLHDSRRAARVAPDGQPILLEDQDRTLWDRDRMAEGRAALARAGGPGRSGPYVLQAAIAALHAGAATAEQTDWPSILALYDDLVAIAPGPVVALNRAVAVAMVHGADAGLRQVDAIAADGSLASYPYLHAARGELLRRLGRRAESVRSYREALGSTANEGERRFLARRIEEVGGG